METTSKDKVNVTVRLEWDQWRQIVSRVARNKIDGRPDNSMLSWIVTAIRQRLEREPESEQ